MEIEAAVLQTLPNGFLVHPGKSEIKIFEDEEEQVMDLVRDEEENQSVVRAKEEYDRRIAKYAKEKCDGDMNLAYQRFPESPQSVYVQQNQGRGVIGMKPLLSAKVIERNLPPPQKEEMFDASRNTADAMAAAVDAIFNNPSLRKMLEDRILNELAEKDSSKNSKGK